VTHRYLTPTCRTRVRILGLLFCAATWVSQARAQDVLAENQDLVPLKAVSVQNRPRPEYDPLGILLGAVRVSPQLTIGESYDDNIYATDTGKVGDRVTTLTGSVGVQSPGQRPPLPEALPLKPMPAIAWKTTWTGMGVSRLPTAWDTALP
jgi:hypothetical protein